MVAGKISLVTVLTFLTVSLITHLSVAEAESLRCGGEKKIIEGIELKKDRITRNGDSKKIAEGLAILACKSHFFSIDSSILPGEHAQACEECGGSGCTLKYHIEGFNNDITFTDVNCWTEVGGKSYCRGNCKFKGSISASCSHCLVF